MDDTRTSSPQTRRGLTPARLALAASAALGLWAGWRHGPPDGLRPLLIGLLPIAALIPLLARTTPPRRRYTAGGPVSGALGAAELAASPDWLQVVSGPDHEQLRHGVLEIGAALLDRGERVLVVDAARRLRLHETLGRDGVPGLLECLAGDLPALEAIRGGVQDRICLLPRGDSMRPEVWPRLGRLLAEVRPHFDRVVLALDFAAPHPVGPALEGLGALGWWCGEPGPSLLPEALAERIGISLRYLRLDIPVETLVAIASGASGTAAPDAASAAAPSDLPALAPVTAPDIPREMDCDLQTRERLRFLIWMRRVHAESLREVEAPRSPGRRLDPAQPSTALELSRGA